jgi:cob(I)alamin adenosyltransferase
MRKAYSKAGDQGYTKDYSGKKLAKDDLVIVVGGKIDSLQSCIDMAILQEKGKNKEILELVQRKMWQTAGEISCADEKCVIDPVTQKDLDDLEDFIDSFGEPPQKFIRFNTHEAILLNECRIRARELETFLVKLLRRKKIRPEVYAYLNRLSSLFFIIAYKKTK